MSAVGDRLRLERERKGLDQATFAALGGVTRNTQANYEKGARAPDTDYLAKLAEHSVDAGFVLTGERNAGALSPFESQLLGLVRDLGERDRAMILDLASRFAGARGAPSRRVSLDEPLRPEDRA